MKRLTAVLEDRDPHSWSFTDDALRWRDFEAKTTAVLTARKHIATSFGSCSVDEPIADLAALGWL
jgi:hypothetical protein